MRAAGNKNKGVEGQADCTALAKVLPARRSGRSIFNVRFVTGVCVGVSIHALGCKGACFVTLAPSCTYSYITRVWICVSISKIKESV